MNATSDDGAVGARPFPPGFLWGASSSAYQVEGAVHEDGRGPSIWDTFAHTPGKVNRGDTGDIACDSYHRMDADLRLLTELGIGAYRFSIAWPRVQPAGSGAINHAGLDYYRSLVEELRRRNIVPVATVYHWELPQALEEQGGWASRDTAERFAEYAVVVADALGDQVGMWVTVNEPKQAVHQGYRTGTHAPGHCDDALAAAATHQILVGHGLALQALRVALPSRTPIGITLDPHPYHALDEDAAAAALQLDVEHNRIYIDAVLHGSYPSEARPELLPPDALIRPGDMELISAPIDFLGLNYYRPHYIRRGDWLDLRLGETPVPDQPGFVEFLPPEMPRSVMNWLVDPDALYRLLLRMRDETGGVPLYITENGCAVDDYISPEGIVDDGERIDYIHAHLDAAWRAIEDGVNLAGYFHWSLMDNFEWARGYQRRFGLYYVDFGSQRRVPKRSAAFYSKVARSGVLPVGPAAHMESEPAHRLARIA
jgi:beta-glucosidase